MLATVVTLGFSSLDFARAAAANFPHDFVTLVDPIRGTYGLLTKRRSTALIDDVFAAVEDRLKVTSTFSLVAGLRVEHLALDRTATNVTGASMPRLPLLQDLGACDWSLRLYLRGHPEDDVLRPVRHRRRPRRR